MGREVSRRRRRGDAPGWGATAMPDLRRNVVELLARVPQEVRTPQEKAGLPALTHAKDVAAGATLYWVSSEMTQLALDAALDLPPWVPQAEAPATTGLILYEHPLPERSPLLPAEEAWEANTAEHRRARATTMCGMMWTCTDDSLTVWPVMKLPQSTPPIIMTGILDTTVPSTRPIEHYPPRWAGAMALLGTTWILMTQDKVTTTQPQEVTTGRDAAIRRRRTQSPAHVQVIDLRPMRHAPTEDTDQTGRRYTHQWVVRGHWRQQPVGPHHSQRRPTWVSSYLKGPQGAPLLTGDRVYAWRR